ncbi:hypothetical protein BVX94_03880, partial [bacterium B17]
MPESIKVLVVDDHAVVLEGLSMILDKQHDIKVMASTSDSRKAVRMIEKTPLDVVVMDICMPGLNGVDAAQLILEQNPSIKIVFLSMYATKEYVYRAMKTGALGYVLKESAGEDLVKAIRSVYLGKRFLSEELRELIIDHHIFKEENMPEKSPLDCLSDRERQVLQLVVEGKSSAEIAKTVHLSRTTVETYRSRLMSKLDIN